MNVFFSKSCSGLYPDPPDRTTVFPRGTQTCGDHTMWSTLNSIPVCWILFQFVELNSARSENEGVYYLRLVHALRWSTQSSRLMFRRVGITQDRLAPKMLNFIPICWIKFNTSRECACVLPRFVVSFTEVRIVHPRGAQTGEDETRLSDI